MSQDNLNDLLRQADEMAGYRAPALQDICAGIRRRAGRRQLTRTVVPVALAAAIVMAACLWHVAARNARIRHEQRMAALEAEIEQLNARADATLRLVQHIVQREQQQRRLAEFEAKLAAMPDPVFEIRQEVEKTAAILLCHADHMYSQPNQKQSVIRTYNRVIELFPRTWSAEQARRKLSEIQTGLPDADSSKI